MSITTLRVLAALIAIALLPAIVLTPVGWGPILYAGAGALLAGFAAFGLD